MQVGGSPHEEAAVWNPTQYEVLRITPWPRESVIAMSLVDMNVVHNSNDDGLSNFRVLPW